MTTKHQTKSLLSAANRFQFKRSAHNLMGGLALSLGAFSLSLGLSLSTPVQAAPINTTNPSQLQASCDNGRLTACSMLAQNYLGQKNYAKAAENLSKVCYSNSPDSFKSCAALTTLLTDSAYGLNDFPSGIRVSEYLCDHSNAYGCLLLSKLYFIEDQVKQDLTKAKTYGEKACSLGDAIGCRQVAVILYSEASALKDPSLAEQSFAFHKAACDLGNKESCNEYSQYERKMEDFRLFVQHSKQQQLQQQR